MSNTKKFMTRLGILAGILSVAAMSSAILLDADIVIRKVLNSPNFTVKYTGAAAAMIELRVNGTSVGTRNVSPSKSAGEVDFALDMSSLDDGENEIEVRLFDRNGKLLGTQRAVVTTGDEMPSPVRMTAPRMGSTVQGPIEIKVGFGRELKNAYVSFFVNDQFKAMTNVAPFSFVWDTTAETNGWHELQAWLVDENSFTFKTRKVRVFVNNPGGRTDRRIPTPTVPVTPAVKPMSTPVKVPTAKVTAPVRTAPVTTPRPSTAPVATAVKAATQAAVTSAPVVDLQPAMNAVTAITTNSVGMKAAPGISATTGPKLVMPSLSAPKANPTSLSSVQGPSVTTATMAANTARMVSITKGQRLPNIGTFAVLLNSKVVSFDVQPRVQDGVPLTPLRHLLEEAGGKVDWENFSKTLLADAEGKNIMVKIGDRIAKINELPVEMEIAPFIDRGRTIVALSFIKDALQVDVEYDRQTGHVLITSIKKN